MELDVEILDFYVKLVIFFLTLGFGSEGLEPGGLIGDMEFLSDFAIHFAEGEDVVFDVEDGAGDKVVGVVFVVEELAGWG